MVNPDDRSESVWAVAILFFALTWITLALRLFVRLRTLASFGLDDKALITSQVFFTAYLICQMGGASYGTGKRLKLLQEKDALTALRFWFACELFYALSAALIKITICLALKRITDKFAHLVVIWGLMLLSAGIGIAFFLGVLFQCIPARDWWSLDPTQKHCLPSHIIESLVYAISAVNVCCDWTLGIFPFVIVKDLAIPRYQKILVASILAFGALGSTATVVRIVYIPTMRQVYKGRDGDFLYLTTDVAIWSTVEPGIAITAMCLSTLRPLINKLFNIQTWNSGSYTGCSYRSEVLSHDSSGHALSPIPFDPDSRARAEAIINAEDEITPWSASLNAGPFNKTRSTKYESREITTEEVELGPGSPEFHRKKS